MKAFSITSPTNSLAVTIYCLIAFIGFGSTVKAVGGSLLQAMPLNESWSMLTFIAGSAAVYATLSAPKRRDPDDSLAIEMWACTALCILFAYFEWHLSWYRSETGAFAVTSFGFGFIFFVGFLARAIQIYVERKNLRKFREDHS